MYFCDMEKERSVEKMKKIKKLLSIFLAISLIVGLWQPLGNVKAEDNLLAGMELLAHYEFKEEGTDSSGKGNHATIGKNVTVKDGIASLPGGAANDSSFIELPGKIFENQNHLTITMWLRDNDPQTSWLAAFFFGSKNNSNDKPTNYYYFNPCEKDKNTLKLVMTDSVDESNPGGTEKGFRNSIRTDSYQGIWTHYAIVIDDYTMTCYIDGVSVGTQTVSRKVSDFGTNLDAYIGKSNYPDPLYQGDFMDFRVYKNALTDTQVKYLVGEQEDKAQYSMTIDGNNVTKKLSDSLYGLFYEDINSAADGGLYPEMVKNYSFENAYMESGDTNSTYFKENGYKTVGNYKLHWTAAPQKNFEVNSEDTQSTENSLNKTNPHYAIITGNVTLENGGFAPQNNPNGAAMPIKPVNKEKNTGTYTFSTYMKAAEGYSGNMKVSLVDSSGIPLANEVEVPLKANGNWEKVSVELTSLTTQNKKGKLIISIKGAGAEEQLFLDMVSLVPHDSYGYGNKNYAYDVGVRKDLVDLMMDLNPKFMRFPGGCIVEGFNWEGLYDWRDSIGPLEQRKSNTNRWENWNNNSRSWGYMQSYGFGYHELLSLCEDFGMEPFPIMSAGVLCQYETSGVNAKTGNDLQYFIDMATNLLDYCWGDATKNAWAAKRAENGHPEPFNLKYIGIGNENVQAKYFDNFDVIKRAVETYAKENYPGHELNIISSAGPTSGGSDFDYALEYAYDRLAQTMPGETIVDEHYYESESFMYNQSDRYDYYQRTDQGGSNVFVGEYAVKNDNKYNTALAEACYITGLERNADVVTNISYAPLLYKIGNLSWSHDLIYFDEFNTAKSTNYYVQKMFANNYGTDLIGTELHSTERDYSNYGSPILGTISSGGYIDKITVYGQDGKILLEDDFNDNSNGWTSFGSNEGTFIISDGLLTFTGTSGNNIVYLPKAIEEKWTNFRIEVEGAVKTSGTGGLVIGAGHERQYYWYNMSQDESGIRMEVTRPERNKKTLTTKTLGNNYANKRYNKENLTKIKNNDFMNISFNFGVKGKIEASYTSASIGNQDTGKYNFSSVLNQYQTDIYQVVNKDSKNVYIKLVNPDKFKKSMQLNFKNLNIATGGQVEVTKLSGGLEDANTIGEEKVSPVTTTQSIKNNQMLYELPARSVNVIRVPLAQKPVPPQEPDKEPEKKVKSINVNPKEKSLSVNETLQLGVTVSPAGANSSVTYKSGDTSIATVTSTGKVTAKKQGTTYITVISKENNTITAKCKITVKKPSITISGSSQVKIGKSIKLKANVKNIKGTVKWSLNSQKFATLTAKGVNATLKAKKKAGTVKVTAQIGSVKVTKSVKVVVPIKSIKLKTKTKSLSVGESFQIKPTITPSDTTNKKVKYTNNNPKVVSVSKSGKVTAKKNGTATITITSLENKNVKVKCKITVKKPSLTISGPSTVKKGKSIQLQVKLKNIKGKVTWSINNKLATIKAKGNKVTIKAKKKTGTIKVTAKVGTIKKTKTIKIKK